MVANGAGHIALVDPPVPLVVPRVRTRVHLVSTQSLNQDVSLWRNYVRCTVNPQQLIERITAPYLPICLVGFSWLLQGGFQAAVGDIVSRGTYG